ncbi:helix-turn-helix transcriptional regulator [Clostridium sp. 'deep sea']|uniref:helix-turn-helix domain-containing protein n=1 Tax=Clostridium sp. 'deep sea' TaxID=2779445 RepID=UPI0018967C73|nr:helix-turn-helix transcriptional regulator [Clostridium sp. 'deep sea']QOR36272.1 helix-turn-helix transcriptional regulator [Clostridium sp. 'deep sea']
MKRLRELRMSIKLSQKEVANILGISRQAYNRYELGKRNPDNTMLIKLATFYDVSIDYLLEKTALKKTASQSINELTNHYKDKKCCYDIDTDKVSANYLKLAYELQEMNIDPDDIRTIAGIIKKNHR